MRRLLMCVLLALPTLAFANTEDLSDEALVQAAEALTNQASETAQGAGPASASPVANTAPSAEGSGTQIALPAQTGSTAQSASRTLDASDAKMLPEDQIPLKNATVKVAKSESNLLWRLILSMGILSVIAGGLVFFTKRYRRFASGGAASKTRIELLSQLALNQKGSVALIRVSGETLLVGVTEQNINMLKPVTLIDDELENTVLNNFNNFLEDDFKVEDVRTALGERN
jgi:flagellar protein FliO/FliZ